METILDTLDKAIEDRLRIAEGEQEKIRETVEGIRTRLANAFTKIHPDQVDKFANLDVFGLIEQAKPHPVLGPVITPEIEAMVSRYQELIRNTGIKTEEEIYKTNAAYRSFIDAKGLKHQKKMRRIIETVIIAGPQGILLSKLFTSLCDGSPGWSTSSITQHTHFLADAGFLVRTLLTGKTYSFKIRTSDDEKSDQGFAVIDKQRDLAIIDFIKAQKKPVNIAQITNALSHSLKLNPLAIRLRLNTLAAQGEIKCSGFRKTKKYWVEKEGT